jgi:Flp pilus assembly protein TadG
MRAKKWLKSRRGYAKDESAATAIEFAMIAPLFFLCLFVVLETGLMLFTEYVLQTSVQEAARLVKTGQAQEQKMTAAKFKKEVCELAGLIINCDAKVTVHMDAKADFTTLSTSTPSYSDIGPKEDGTIDPPPFQCGTPGEAVALIATYDWDFSVPYFMSFLGNRKNDTSRRLAGFAMFKNEPFPNTGSTCG